MAVADLGHPQRVAVIGAGMAGSACAGTLAEHGIAVELFEKSRGVGGRLAARPVGDQVLDIGAQYATARGSGFQALVDRQISDGAASAWQPMIQDSRLDGDEVIDRRDPWFVGVPGMDALTAPLPGSAQIRFGARIRRIARQPQGWLLEAEDGGTSGPFAAVAVTAPAPQTLTIVGEHDPLFEAIAELSMSPCWTVACVFERPVACDVDVIRPSRSAVTWSARNGSKPGREGDNEGWVIHGDPVWSLDHLEREPETVVAALLDAFRELTGSALPATIAIKTHRWRFARVVQPLGVTHLLGCDDTLGVAGDWCLGARIEAAYDSGRALGRALADRLRNNHPEID